MSLDRGELCSGVYGEVELVVNNVHIRVAVAEPEVSCVSPCTEGYNLFWQVGRRGQELVDQ